MREAIPHIAEASCRDRAQLAAHDVAQLESLPTSELIERRDTLSSRAELELNTEAERATLQERIEGAEAGVAALDSQRERARELPRKQRRSELQRIHSHEVVARQALERLEARLGQLPPPEDAARRELAAAQRVLDHRLGAAVLAARLAPPRYITNELGKRPLDPTKQRAWDRGVAEIESYRQQHGITDPSQALGRLRTREMEQQATRRRIRETRQTLGLDHELSPDRGLEMGIGL
jgi:hypothetical protein